MENTNNIAAEFGGISFGDKRLDQRFEKTAEQLGKHAKGSVLSATGGRNNARGFYRLLENDKFSLEGTSKNSLQAHRRIFFRHTALPSVAVAVGYDSLRRLVCQKKSLGAASSRNY